MFRFSLSIITLYHLLSCQSLSNTGIQDELITANAHATQKISTWSGSRKNFLSLISAVGSTGGVVSSCPAFGTLTDANPLYDRYADSYDRLDGGFVPSVLGIDKLRRDLIFLAEGKVLEIAVGTGLNLPYYDFAKVNHFEAIDESEAMLHKAAERVDGLQLNGRVRLRKMNAEELQSPDNTFDTVVDTFGLCVFSNPLKALSEMKRVCKPNGRILLLENSRSDVPMLAAYQDATSEALTSTSKGCIWNQDVRKLLQQADIRVVSEASAACGLFQSFACIPTK